METLWRNVSKNRRNIVPVLDFLVAHGYANCNYAGSLQASYRQGIAPLAHGQWCAMCALTGPFW